jgi:hypothetical protein
MTTPPPSPPTTPSRNYNQVVKGKVDIKQLCKTKYKITFYEVSKFLLYQTWSGSNTTLNDERRIFSLNAKEWIKNFESINKQLKKDQKPLYTPTTIMEIGNPVRAFDNDEC